MRYRDSHDLRSGTPTRGLLPRKLYLKKHMHPNLMAALIPRDRIWSNQQGNRHRPGQQGVAHTPGKGTSHPRRRKECPQQRHGRTQGGAQEAGGACGGRSSTFTAEAPRSDPRAHSRQPGVAAPPPHRLFPEKKAVWLLLPLPCSLPPLPWAAPQHVCSRVCGCGPSKPRARSRRLWSRCACAGSLLPRPG